jgi:nitroimidazol reductase NimA-like FMN-containing flavoprotein (pyridoxamine 5'-phosphate oxidase superfamily)
VTTSLPLSSTSRTRLHRHKERGRTSRADLYAVLDAGMVCHLGVVADGSPVVLPTAYGRDGDTLFLHGSSANSSFLTASGREVCVTVTHLDGLVCARSVFSHSMNYRSAVIFGTASLITDPGEALAALRVIVEHLLPGQWDAVRQPTRKELAATAVLRVPLAEASVKIRTGPPADQPEDAGAGGWAGVIPVRAAFGEPEADIATRPGTPVPPHIRALTGRGRCDPGNVP